MYVFKKSTIAIILLSVSVLAMGIFSGLLFSSRNGKIEKLRETSDKLEKQIENSGIVARKIAQGLIADSDLLSEQVDRSAKIKTDIVGDGDIAESLEQGLGAAIKKSAIISNLWMDDSGRLCGRLVRSGDLAIFEVE